MTIDAVLTRIDQTLPEALARLSDLLPIPSISTDPAFKGDCDRAADWLVSNLASLGFAAVKHSTSGHPMVVDHAGSGGPHFLFYGHPDVQPVDPAIEHTPEGKVIRASGASDDKCQLMPFVEACRA